MIWEIQKVVLCFVDGDGSMNKDNCPLEECEKELPKASEMAKQIFSLLTQDLLTIESIQEMTNNLVNDKLIKVNYNKKELDKLKVELSSLNKEFDETYINKDDQIALKEAGLVKVEDLKKSIRNILKEQTKSLEDNERFDNQETNWIQKKSIEFIVNQILELLGDKDEYLGQDCTKKG